MDTWIGEAASNGFSIVFPYLPQSLNDVTQRLVPELQRCGLFRQDNEGTTLREQRGLPRPGSKFLA